MFVNLTRNQIQCRGDGVWSLEYELYASLAEYELYASLADQAGVPQGKAREGRREVGRLNSQS